MKQKKRLLNLKVKFLAVVLIPVLATFAIIGIYSRVSWNRFSTKINDQSTAIVTAMAEEAIVNKARAVAKEIGLALDRFPGIKPEQLNETPLIRQLAIQKVGRTGYTVLWAVPDQGSEVSPTWIHPENELIGKDTPPLVKNRLGGRYKDWFSVYKGCYNGGESKGYYLWEDDQGNLRQKFLACVPVENSLYAISATTYLDEFLTPVKQIETQVNGQLKNIGTVHLLTMGAGLVIFIACVTVAIQRITRQIVRLTRAIEDVSMGNVDNSIKIVKSNDELQDLAEAFERMRTGVKFIMQRFEKMKENR